MASADAEMEDPTRPRTSAFPGSLLGNDQEPAWFDRNFSEPKLRDDPSRLKAMLNGIKILIL